jgi:carboxyl-terminal processing protease
VKPSLLTILLMALFPAAVPAQVGASRMTEDERQRNLLSFEMVWSTVRDTHWQKDKPGGLDWQSIHDEFRPRMEQAESSEAVRALLNEMLGRLQQTHFGVFPPENQPAANPDLGKLSSNGLPLPGEGPPGFEVQILDGRAIVTEVVPDSPAARAGVKLGWEVVSAGGEELEPLIARLTADASLVDLQRELALTARLTGDARRTQQFVFREKIESRKTRSLDLGPAGAAITSSRAGVSKPAFVETRRIGPHHRIGYIRVELSMDLPRVLSEFSDAMHTVSDSKALLIDLRGNPGSLAGPGIAMGMAGWLVKEPGLRLGTLYQRNATMIYSIVPRAETFSGPVAVLVDELSAPIAVVFASGLHDLGRARLFGARTAPLAPIWQVGDLPNGDRFEHAVVNYTSAKGESLEFDGVVPDVEVSIARQILLDKHDPVIDAAVKWGDQARRNAQKAPVLQ